MAVDKQKVSNLKGPAPWTTAAPWAANTAYQGSKAPASCVTYMRQTLVCVADHTSSAAFDPTKWVLLIPAPNDGQQGPRGASMFSGNGPPSAAVVSAAVAGQDGYLDLASGDTYSFS